MNGWYPYIKFRCSVPFQQSMQLMQMHALSVAYLIAFLFMYDAMRHCRSIKELDSLVDLCPNSGAQCAIIAFLGYNTDCRQH